MSSKSKVAAVDAPGPAPGTRDRLLEAAARVIVRDGYQGARLADVAREAGLTTGAVYSNFRSKEDLLLAAFDRVQETRQRALVPEGEFRSFAGTIDAMAQMLSQLVQSHELRVLSFELGLLATRDERIAGELKRGFGQSVKDIGRGLPSDRELKAAGVPLRRDELATVMLALFNGLAVVAMFDRERVTPDLAGRALRQLFEGP
ncbi:MAG: TetR/AcrR family transcriptional regulator [Candidatus Dormibacteraeota bacterium]|nr:TetR/AcrR family transcriptional regulator [Candidatus Dormibacteraeota bacterium]